MRIRRVKPARESHLAIQRRVSKTLVSEIATGDDAVMTERDADDLAFRVADDLMSIEPSVPEQHWVPRRK